MDIHIYLAKFIKYLKSFLYIKNGMYATWHSHLLCCTKITTERKVTKLQNYIVNIHAATLFHSLKLCNYDTLVATIIYQPIDCFYG